MFNLPVLVVERVFNILADFLAKLISHFSLILIFVELKLYMM